MANKKSTAFFEAGSWYHRIKILQKDGTTKYSKKGGFATAKEAEASYHKYEEEYKKYKTLCNCTKSSITRFFIFENLH